MRGIGRLARESGLTVSALRFYDGAGVLVPARVDPQTNYRSYSDEQVGEARLVARLRRVGLPIADIRRVLEHRNDRALVDAVLGAHLARLEDGLADARRALATVRTLLDEENPVPTVRLTAPTRALTAALRAVRPAAGTDPGLPMLHGVLVDADGDTLQLVATDRYRLAVAGVPGASGGPGRILLPPTLVDALLDVLLDVLAGAPVDAAEEAVAGGLVEADSGTVTVTVTVGEEITVEVAGRTLVGRVPGDEFPDYRPLLRRGSGRVLDVDGDRLGRDLAAAPTRTVHDERTGTGREVSVLGLAPDGTLLVGAGEDPIGVDREFLLQALRSTGPGQLELELDGPIAPLALRHPQRAGNVVLLMPVRLG